MLYEVITDQAIHLLVAEDIREGRRVAGGNLLGGEGNLSNVIRVLKPKSALALAERDRLLDEQSYNFV